ncbi:MAG: ATP-dependent RNA helicase HrpA [Ilumatobacteraceae bacterium]
MSESDAVERRRAARLAVRTSIVEGGRLRYPAELPITARHDELLAAIRDHQVVIVAGETGSGKSTQLPKLCLELGRGVDGMIGHTQPRRVAARTIAERVAEELGTPLGDAVGYSVRFDDRVRDATLVRVMTDGILLAELRRDRQLRRYDTLIVDEAHERSLNVDFLLGYLRRLLPQRPDLKVIVTSATIDTARFAEAFAQPDGVDAPVIEVTGRTYPVEPRYRPLGDADSDDQRDQVQAIGDAVTELGHEGPGDILVFLSGEREIRDAADALHRRLGPGTDVLPMYARLSAAEQHRIFEPHAGRRVVLSTNVAETSITVPGVRFVIDTGVARISRYSRRLKVQRLPIEPISRASADQRAGRCGRVGPGVCVRLYAEDDYAARPEFTEPELLRTNLASVILQMLALDLGDVVSFPFVEPPDTAAVRDGHLLLEELGAISETAHGIALTEVGRRLARLPVDPRLGRMILAAGRHGCGREVLVIAAALSIRDPRERPLEHQAAADEAHRAFDVPGSDLLSIVRLWDHLREEQRRLSGNQFRKLCRTEFLNYVRVREWHDLFSQLRRVAGELDLRVNAEAAAPDDVHRAVLSGLLSHIGMRDRDERQFRGARNASFVIAPGSVLARKPPRWVMAAELVETDRLRARRVATITPEWVERSAGHLVKRSYGEPWWDRKRGTASTTESVTLYGLPIVTGRVVPLDRIAPAEAREMFVRHALVDGDWGTHHSFVERNATFRARVTDLEARVRRSGLLDDDAVERFYDERVPADVTSGRRFDRWWRDAGPAGADRLDLTEDLVAGGTVRWADVPSTWSQGDLVLPLTYRYAPGEPLDGVTVHVPQTALNQVSADGFDWQVPGYRRELVGELLRTLPKEQRRALIPMADTAAAVFDRLGPPNGRLVDALASAVADVTGVRVAPSAFRSSEVAAHLRVNYVVADAEDAVVDADIDLDAIRRRLAATTRAAIAAASLIDERAGIVDWDLDSLPPVITTRIGSHATYGYPALLDDGDSVSLRVLTTPQLQQRVMRGGVRRLLALTAGPSAASVRRDLDGGRRAAVATAGIPLDELAGDCALAAVDALLDTPTALPWDAETFGALQRAVRREAPNIAQAAMVTAADVLAAETRVRDRLAALTAPSAQPIIEDAEAHLGRLLRPGFVLAAGTGRLPDVLRYVRGIEHRLERLDPARDARRRADVVPLEQRHAALVGTYEGHALPQDVADIGWLLEELRVSLFAQPLGTRQPVSPTRLGRVLDDLTP